MPKEDDIGYGELTSLKIEQLKRIYAMHLAITQAVVNKFDYYQNHYHYVDLTSGQGSYPDGTKGSPLVFLDQSQPASQMSFRIDLIEKNSENLKVLKKTVEKEIRKNNWYFPSLNFHEGRYQDIAPQLLKKSSRNQFGLMFVDPSGSAPDFDTISVLAKLCPKMEILMYISATNIKRIYQHTQKLLSDYMQEVGKKYWLIRKPLRWDQHQWTFLLGSDTEIFRDYKRIDFLRLDSEDAQNFFPKLNLSTKQRQERLQRKLFE